MYAHTLATFAYHNPRTAVGLIILTEVSNATIGLIMGSILLARQPGWYLTVSLTILLTIRHLYKRYATLRLIDLVSSERFHFQKKSYTFLFIINILTYIVAGGISGRSVAHPEPSVSVSCGEFRSYSYASETDSLGNPSTKTAFSKNSVPAKNPERAPLGTRIGYCLLFLTSVLLAVGASGLACNLACANQGFAAVLVVLLGMGVLAGGLYFLGRAFDKNMKLYKEMTKEERKREGRRFGRTLLGTVIGLGIFALLGSFL